MSSTVSPQRKIHSNDPAQGQLQGNIKMNPLLGDINESSANEGSRGDIQSIIGNLTKMKPDEIPIPFRGQCLGMTQDKKSLVIASCDGRLCICNRMTKEVTNDVQLPGDNLRALALYQNDKYILTGGTEAVIRMYQTSDFKEVSQLRGHDECVTGIMLSPDEKLLYTSSHDTTVRIWDMETRTNEIIYNHENNMYIHWMDMSHDGQILTTGGDDKNVFIYDLVGRKIVTKLQATDHVNIVRLTRSKSMVAAGLNDGKCLIWDLQDHQLKHVLNGHIDMVMDIKFLDNEKVVITGSVDTTVRVWSLIHQRNEIVYNGHLAMINYMMLSDDQRQIYTISDDCRILIWNVPTNMESEKRLIAHTDTAFNCLVSQKRNQMYTNSQDNKVIVWDAVKRCKVKELLHDDGVYAMTLSADQDFIIAPTFGKQVVMWNLDNHEPYYVNDFSEVVIHSICCTPDGRYLITGDDAQRITVTEYKSPLISENRPFKYVFRKHKTTVWSLTTTNDSITLITGGEDGSIVLYDLNKGSETGMLLGHTNKIRCLAVSRNDEILISGSEDKKNNFKIWSLKKQFLYKSIEYHTDYINGIYFSKDQQYFIVASTDTKISFWNYNDFSFITALQFKDLCRAINCSPDEKTMYVVEKGDIYIQDNPMNASSFQFVGPSKDYFPFLNYIDKIINGENVSHDPEMDKWLIAPLRMNAVHLYAYFNRPSHLKAAFRESSPIYNSTSGRNPLSLSIEREFTDCVNAILSSLNKKVADSPQSLYLLEDLIFLLNKNGYSMLDELYSCLLIQSSDTTLPKFIDYQVALPIVASSSTNEINTDLFSTKDNFKSEGKSIMFWTTYIKFDMSIGSQASIDFLESTIQCPNEEIFRTKFIKIVLEEKWKAVRWIMRTRGIIYVFYLFLLSMYTIEYIGSLSFTAPIFVVNLFLMIYEIYQMALSGFDYWTNIWNYLDMFRGGFYFVYCLLLLLDQYSEFNYYILVCVTSLSWFRGITYFRLFENTRYLIDLLKQILKDMISFLIIFFYSTSAFALIFVAIKEGETSFTDFLRISYRINLGDFDTGDYSDQEWIIFFFISLINTLVMLNLLISIMGDSYDRVQDGREIADRKELAKMILECESLPYWRRGLGKKLYVHMIAVQEHLTQNDTWMGKVRELKLKLVSVSKTLIESVVQLLSDNRRLEGKLGELLEKIEKVNKKTNESIEELKTEHSKQLEKIMTSLQKLEGNI